MRFSMYQNDKHVSSGTLDLTEVLALLKKDYGTNTGLIVHSQATPSFQEYWKIPINHDVFTVINLDS